jgi:hypothetical protein
MKTATAALLAAKAVALFAAGVVIACLPGRAWAHFDGRASIRVVHVTYDRAGMTAYYRVSLAALGPAPYVITRTESGQPFRYVDMEKLTPLAAARVLAAGHAVAVDGRQIAPDVLAAAVHVRGSVPPFATPAQARAATLAATALPAAMPEIADVVLDAAVHYPGVGPSAFRLVGRIAGGVLGEAPLTSVVLSHRAGGVEQYRLDGIPGAYVDVNPPLWLSAWQFVRAGAAHILEGADHLLLVVCLVAGSAGLRAIALRITAFSIGHACSIAASFYGLLPEQPWLPPAVELLIALSVLATALLLMGRHERGGAPVLLLLVGLVHGCGLAYGLRALLSASGPNVVASLVSFNAGVEAGQLVVGAAVWLVLMGMRTAAPGQGDRVRRLVALGVALVSLGWCVERTGAVRDALQGILT